MAGSLPTNVTPSNRSIQQHADDHNAIHAAVNGAAYISAGSGDQTTALNSWLSDGNASSIKQMVGAFNVSGTLTVPAGVHLDMTRASVTQSTSAISTFAVGSGCTLVGGTVTSPAAWDGTNSQPTYAVVYVTGDGSHVRNVKLVNVQRVGIYFDDTDSIDVTGCTIVANYPAASFTGTQTGHLGISYNPSTANPGRGVIANNNIQTCVQGIFLGNYGSGSNAYGLAITGNSFYGCHNHGIYSSTGMDAISVTGNAFAQCQSAVAMTGNAHVVSGNTIYTASTGSGRDIAGISLREPLDCTISGNVIKGDAASGDVVIDLANISGTVCSRNTVTGNVVDVSGGSSIAIRVGRASATTTCHDNIVSGNTIRSVGTANLGVITLSPGSGAASWGNKITGNTVIVLGNTNGIHVLNTSHATVQNNSIRFEYDSGSAITLAAVALVAATYCTVSTNDIHNPATFGTNVALRGVWEQTGSDNNRLVQNQQHADLTKLASYTHFFLVTNSNTYLDERITGSPAGNNGAPGSRISRIDGGTSTSLYVKETANTSSTWRAV